MKYFVVSSFTILVLFGCFSKKKNPTQELEKEQISMEPYIEHIDERLNEIIAPDAKVEIIAEGFDWTEGPLWIDGIGLLFSDIPANKIFKWSEKNGTELYLTPSGYTGSVSRGGEGGSNGLLLDEHNNLILCQHGDRRIAKMNASLDNPKPEFQTIIDKYLGKKLNSPNDACFNSSGDLYFTDPPYGLENRMDDPLKETDFQGVYKYSKDGSMALLTKKMSRPNGIALSPDEKTLYVANSDPENAIWMVYDLNDEGLIDSEKEFYNVTAFVKEEHGLPDGLKVDAKGNLFATGPGGVWIFNASGEVLGKIKTGQATSNCGFGNNGKVLYITADMYVMKVNLK